MKEDHADFVTYCEWTTSALHSKHYMGGFRLQERTGSAKDKLEKHSQEGAVKNGNHLERG